MEPLKLKRLGQAIRNVSDSLDEEGLAKEKHVQRELLHRIQTPGRRTKSRVRPLLLAAAACLAALASFSVWASHIQSDVSYLVDERAGVEGQWVATQDAPRVLHFSERSSVRLRSATRLRVNALTQTGAEILLERGTVDADFVPQKHARWVLRAGPFSVLVTGTRFRLSWEPDLQELELDMAEGSVVVDGPGMNGSRRVADGQRLRVSLTEKTVGMTARGFVDPGSNPSKADATSNAARPEADATASPGKDTAGQSVQSPPKRQADATGSMSNQEEHERHAPDDLDWWGQDTARKLSQAASSELLALADAARLAGRGTLAQNALIQVRDAHGVRNNTAYLLGKVCADQLGDGARAARWFETYLREQPRGALREQALGRLLAIGLDGGLGLRHYARNYLDEYPDGAYHALAQSILESATSKTVDEH